MSRSRKKAVASTALKEVKSPKDLKDLEMPDPETVTKTEHIDNEKASESALEVDRSIFEDKKHFNFGNLFSKVGRTVSVPKEKRNSVDNAKPKIHRIKVDKKVKDGVPPVEFEVQAHQLQNIKKRLLSLNPVFVRMVAAVPILGAAVSLKNGIMISCGMLLTIVFLNILLIPIYRFIPTQYRCALSFVAAGIVITPVCMAFEYLAPTIFAGCGIYLPIIAVAALTMVEKKHFGRKYAVLKTARDAFLNGLGFAFAAILFSSLREIISNGTFYDRPLPYISAVKFKFATYPAGAFILLAVLAALFRRIFNFKADSEEEME